MNSTCSILIASAFRHEYLKKNLSSLVVQEEAFTVHLLINGNDTFSEKIANDFLNKLDLRIHRPQISLSPGAARNFLLQQAQSEWLLFLDDDAFLPSAYLKIWREKIRQYPELGIMGGPNLNPPQSSEFAQLCSVVLESFLGSFIFRWRYKKGKEQIVKSDRQLILCNLWIKKNLLQSLTFNEEVESAEENMLLKELFKKQLEALYCPELFVFHYRRDTFADWIRQIEKFGRGRGYLLSFWQVALLSLLGPVAVLLSPFYFLFLMSYSLLKKPTQALTLCLIFISLHFYYFQGIFKTKMRSDSPF